MPDFIDVENFTVEQQQAFRDAIKTPWASGQNNLRATFFDELPIGEQIIVGIDVDGEFNQAIVIPYNEPGGVPQINDEGIIPARVSVFGGTYAELQDTIFPKNELVIEWSGNTALNLRVGDGITPGGQVLATRPHSITGDAYQGQTLTSGVAKQWLLNGEPISGQTGDTLTVPESVILGDVISQEGSVAIPVIRIPDSCGIKVDTTLGGFNFNQFRIIARDVSNYDCRVYWGDGSYSDITSYNDPNLIHEYGTPGEYDVQISGTFRAFHFNNIFGWRSKLIGVDQLGNTGWDTSQQNAFRNCDNLQYFNGADEWSHVTNLNLTWFGCPNLTSFPELDTSSVTDFSQAWTGCSSLTSFPKINTSSGTNFNSTWNSCSGLTSFPELDVSNGTDFRGAWNNCSGLTSFPMLDTSSGTLFNETWKGCSNLTSFPELNLSSGTNFSGAWQQCTALTSFPELNFSSGTNFTNAWALCTGLVSFPELNVSSGINFLQAWGGCSSLVSFPELNVSSGMNFNYTWGGCTGLTEFKTRAFDSLTNGTDCFTNTTLPTEDWSGILVYIEANNPRNTATTIHGGNSKHNSAGAAAKLALEGRNWTITDGGPE